MNSTYTVDEVTAAIAATLRNVSDLSDHHAVRATVVSQHRANH